MKALEDSNARVQAVMEMQTDMQTAIALQLMEAQSSTQNSRLLMDSIQGVNQEQLGFRNFILGSMVGSGVPGAAEVSDLAVFSLS